MEMVKGELHRRLAKRLLEPLDCVNKRNRYAALTHAPYLREANPGVGEDPALLCSRSRGFEDFFAEQQPLLSPLEKMGTG